MKEFHSYRYLFAIVLCSLLYGTVSSQNVLTCSDIGGTGDLDNRCTLGNTSYYLSDGNIISGTGILELKNHGELHLTAGSSFTIDMGGDVFIQNGGRIYGNVDITCNNLYVDGAINTAARGYGSSEGPGAGEDGTDSIEGGAGAGYGGYGGNGQNTVGSAGSAYEFALTEPTDMGSGGGEQQFWFTATGGKGGGAVKVMASGTVTVNGTIGANGDAGWCMGPNYCSGGGSGGGVWIQASELKGTGSITANGGNGGIGVFSGGGGGGGRIALYYSSNTFIGSITASGGFGIEHGGAGTVFEQIGTTTNLTVENKLIDGAFTPIDLGVSQTFDNLSIDDSARITLFGSPNNTVIGNFTVGSTGYVTSPTNLAWLNLSVENFTIETGGDVDYNGKGYGPALGISMGESVTNATQGAGGGGYGASGGQGSNSSGIGGTGEYGSEYQPINYGSGGGNVNVSDTVLGGYGGGAIWLNVSQVLNIDGTISANGTNGGSASGSGAGGGSGGSIVLCAETFSGNGTVSVNGGAGGDDQYAGGGGSGGRLAIYTQNYSFTGDTLAIGGTGFTSNPGGDGSIVSETECGTLPILIETEEPVIIHKDEFNIYPNPNNGTFNVSMYLSEKRNVTLRVVNLVGQEIYSEELSQVKGSNIKNLFLEHVPSGIYYISIITDEVVFNKKIVLQH